MNPTESQRVPMIIAVAVVLLAAAVSWKFFYADPNTELSGVKSENAAARAAQQATRQHPAKLYTADRQTIAAAASAGRKLPPTALRRLATSSAEAAGLKGLKVAGDGGALTVSATGSSAVIGEYLSSLQGDLRIENEQIRGRGPLVRVSGLGITGETPASESIEFRVSSGP